MAEEKKIAVQVNHITKSFNIPLEMSSGLKQKLINTLKGRKGYRVFTPLNDVTFEVEEGDFFGIVGRNGSGKSTLLKTIAGIYSPNQGAVGVNGKLVPFIELGVGFNPELTGRENVYLNGALLGFSRKEMEAMYDDIVGFAELHDFMEERLKNYSSGMQVRLAFSIAIRAEGDILLLDEVLAVGDESFQRKCYSYFDDLRRRNKTVILVTHDMRAVERYCNRAMFIENGDVVKIGTPYEISELYSRANEEEPVNTDEEKKNTKEKSGKKAGAQPTLSVLNVAGEEKKSYEYGETIVAKVAWHDERIHHIGIALIRRDGEYVFGTNTYQEKLELGKNKQIEYRFDANLFHGDYFLKVGFFGKNDVEKIDFIHQGPIFMVKKDYGSGEWGGVTKLNHKWDV